MRLGDLDALKKAYFIAIEKSSIGEVSIVNLIDNAPTVEYPFEKFRTMLCGTCQAYMRIEPERSQGEWVGIEEYDDYPNKKVCECSECGKMIDISHNDFPNFCSNCGADMKKGEEE